METLGALVTVGGVGSGAGKRGICLFFEFRSKVLFSVRNIIMGEYITPEKQRDASKRYYMRNWEKILLKRRIDDADPEKKAHSRELRRLRYRKKTQETQLKKSTSTSAAKPSSRERGQHEEDQQIGNILAFLKEDECDCCDWFDHVCTASDFTDRRFDDIHFVSEFDNAKREGKFDDIVEIIGGDL